ncbi:MAG: tRNA pseudouridine(13) synthase TruD [Candidatus Syntropharchaeia archaeon]
MDADIGIEVYITKSEGIGGTIKKYPSDFRVFEITSRSEGEEGNYLIVEVTKENWDTHHLVRDLSRVLGVSRKRFGWAGTKDRKAIATQKMSIWGIKEGDLERIKLPGVSIKKIGYSNKPVSLGDLYGNEFEITVRDIDLPREIAEDRVRKILKEMEEKGVPNFFGEQRFGTSRPVTHLVGREIVLGNFEKAAMLYIAEPFPDESEETKKARKYIKDTLDFRGKLPNFLRYERAMLDYLIKNPGDYKGAFNVLPENLKKLFVHAYQSYIFNLILSRRIKEGIPLNQAVVGDIVCFKNEIGFPDPSRTQKVTEKTVDGINNLIKRGRAWVTLPLIGYETELAEGIQGEIEEKVLEEQKIDKDDFRIPSMPELASKGTRREITLPLNLKYEIGDGWAKFKFSLPKGGYATVLLREIIKS